MLKTSTLNQRLDKKHDDLPIETPSIQEIVPDEENEKPQTNKDKIRELYKKIVDIRGSIKEGAPKWGNGGGEA
jgi:hypothetical protein